MQMTNGNKDIDSTTPRILFCYLRRGSQMCFLFGLCIFVLVDSLGCLPLVILAMSLRSRLDVALLFNSDSVL